MEKDIEEIIKKYFPKRWTRADVSFFLDKPRYVLDMNAVNENLNAPIRDFVIKGGKRLRPVLFLTCLDLFGKNYKKYIDFALIVELIHSGTLVLDDIEDEGELRRGQPASHKKFGLDTAVNVGFSLHVLPLKIIFKKHKELNGEQQLRIWQICTEEMVNVAFGQSIDIYWHKNSANNVSVNKYLEMARLKTGSLMRMALRMACAIAKRDGKTEASFKDFGELIGMAFQIRDDSLDLLSYNSEFGKVYGNDITEGKMSLPVVFALRDVSRKKRERLVGILKAHSRNARLLKEAREIIRESGSVDKSMAFANKMIDEAWENLENSFNEGDKLEKLKELTYFFVKRDY